MSPKDERFLQRKFDIQPGDSIDTRLEQQLTTAMRLDLFYQTAECRTVGGADGVSVVLIAGNRKTREVGAGFRYDLEEHAAIQLGANFPLACPHAARASWPNMPI